MDRVKVRCVVFDDRHAVVSVIEQEIPKTWHEAGLMLRRDAFRTSVALAMEKGGSVTLEFEDK